MQIILSSAKLMHHDCAIEPQSTPLFQHIAEGIAREMAMLDVEEVARLLDCNTKIAAENCLRFRDFFTAKHMPAIMAYNGQAYKHLKALELSDETLAYAQSHLWITTFLYGLLRPMDGIVPYRMEQNVALDATNDVPVNRFWRDKLTDRLIESVKADDGVLVHLSTEEYEHLFDWRRVCNEVKVVQPMFYVRSSEKLRMQAVWAKTCRGAMTRFILQNRIANPDELQAFLYEGFTYNPLIGEESFPHFVKEV